MERGGPVTTLRRALALGTLTAPFHPIVVHFTIALFVAALVSDVAMALFDIASLTDVGWWLLLGSCLTTPVTLVTGAASRIRIPMEEGEARSFLRAHMALGPMLFGLLICLTLWRGALWEAGAPLSAAYFLALVGAALVMTLQGYLGGELVYRYGAEVKDRYRPLPGHKPHTPPPLIFPHRLPGDRRAM